MCKAINVAKWFIKNNYEAPDSFDGNMKLNKLLYFAQLISLVKREKALFKDELYAFEHGVVVENVRKEYYGHYNSLIEEASKFNDSFLDDEEEILNLTNEIFGDVSAEELSELTHQHDCWKDCYNKSKVDGWYFKEDSIIEVDNLIKNYQQDLNLVRNIVSAYEENNSEDNDEEFVLVNSVKFYYNPKEMKITDDILRRIEKFPADDLAYSMYIDESQGLVVY